MNLRKILDTALMVNDPLAYAQGRAEKRRQALEEADAIARHQLMKSQGDAAGGRVENAAQANVTRLISTLKSGKFTPQQIEDIASSLPGDQQVVLRQGLSGHQPVVDAGLGRTRAQAHASEASAGKAEADTLTLTERELRARRGEAAIAALRAIAAQRNAQAANSGKAKAGDPDKAVARIEDQIHQAKKELDSGEISQQAFQERIDQLTARIERTKSGAANPARAATVAEAGRGSQKKAAEPLPEPTPAPKAPQLKFGGRVWTAADVQSGELAKQRETLRSLVSRRPEVRAQVLSALRAIGIGNPEDFLGR